MESNFLQSKQHFSRLLKIRRPKDHTCPLVDMKKGNNIHPDNHHLINILHRKPYTMTPVFLHHSRKVWFQIQTRLTIR